MLPALSSSLSSWQAEVSPPARVSSRASIGCWQTPTKDGARYPLFDPVDAGALWQAPIAATPIGPIARQTRY